MAAAAFAPASAQSEKLWAAASGGAAAGAGTRASARSAGAAAWDIRRMVGPVVGWVRADEVGRPATEPAGTFRCGERTYARGAIRQGAALQGRGRPAHRNANCA